MKKVNDDQNQILEGKFDTDEDTSVTYSSANQFYIPQDATPVSSPSTGHGIDLETDRNQNFATSPELVDIQAKDITPLDSATGPLDQQHPQQLKVQEFSTPSAHTEVPSIAAQVQLSDAFAGKPWDGGTFEPNLALFDGKSMRTNGEDTNTGLTDIESMLYSATSLSTPQGHSNGLWGINDGLRHTEQQHIGNTVHNGMSNDSVKQEARDTAHPLKANLNPFQEEFEKFISSNTANKNAKARIERSMPLSSDRIDKSEHEEDSILRLATVPIENGQSKPWAIFDFDTIENQETTTGITNSLQSLTFDQSNTARLQQTDVWVESSRSIGKEFDQISPLIAAINEERKWIELNPFQNEFDNVVQALRPSTPNQMNGALMDSCGYNMITGSNLASKEADTELSCVEDVKLRSSSSDNDVDTNGHESSADTSDPKSAIFYGHSTITKESFTKVAHPSFLPIGQQQPATNDATDIMISHYANDNIASGERVDVKSIKHDPNPFQADFEKLIKTTAVNGNVWIGTEPSKILSTETFVPANSAGLNRDTDISTHKIPSLSNQNDSFNTKQPTAVDVEKCDDTNSFRAISESFDASNVHVGKDKLNGIRGVPHTELVEPKEAVRSNPLDKKISEERKWTEENPFQNELSKFIKTPSAITDNPVNGVKTDGLVGKSIISSNETPKKSDRQNDGMKQRNVRSHVKLEADEAVQETSLEVSNSYLRQEENTKLVVDGKVIETNPFEDDFLSFVRLSNRKTGIGDEPLGVIPEPIDDRISWNRTNGEISSTLKSAQESKLDYYLCDDRVEMPMDEASSRIQDNATPNDVGFGSSNTGNIDLNLFQAEFENYAQSVQMKDTESSHHTEMKETSIANESSHPNLVPFDIVKIDSDGNTNAISEESASVRAQEGPL